MKNLNDITKNLKDITTIINGVQKLQERFILSRTVIDCNEILIKEEKQKMIESIEKYSNSNDLKESFIDLHNSTIKNLESRKERAMKYRTQIHTMLEIMEIDGQYGKFLYTREDWDSIHDTDMRKFSDKYAVLH